MSIVHETELPGVGTRFAFRIAERRVIGVIRHHGGRRELFVADDADPDRVAYSLGLGEDEAHLLADLLGGSEITREAGVSAQGVAGLTVDWIEVRTAAVQGRTIGELQIRARTGASIVAVLRGDSPSPAPGADFALESGDVAMVVGTAEGIRAAATLLQDREEPS